jgi:DNA-directed RNA polymerase specialized sigma24 family protein
METHNWDKIYLQLYAFADYLLKMHEWFRGAFTDSYLEGRQPHDYVNDAIEYHLRNPEKFDPAKRTLVSYLKRHLIRRAISNDSKRAENVKTANVLYLSQDSDEESEELIEAFLPHNPAVVDQQIDFDMIMRDIEQAVQSDEVAKKIFDGLGREDIKRREIIKIHNMPEEVYDNGMKRLKTILKQTVKKYEIEEPKRVRKRAIG